MTYGLRGVRSPPARRSIGNRVERRLRLTRLNRATLACIVWRRSRQRAGARVWHAPCANRATTHPKPVQILDRAYDKAAPQVRKPPRHVRKWVPRRRDLRYGEHARNAHVHRKNRAFTGLLACARRMWRVFCRGSAGDPAWSRTCLPPAAFLRIIRAFRHPLLLGSATAGGSQGGLNRDSQFSNLSWSWPL